ARRLARLHVETSESLTPHHRVHGIAQTVDVEELAGEWATIHALTPRARDTVAQNAATPCIRNGRTLLLCALASAHLGDEKTARELEREAGETQMEDNRAWLAEARLRLALLRGDLEAVAGYVSGTTRFRAALGPAPLAARLDALA